MADGERARAGPAEVGRIETGRKPEAMGRDQQGPPKKGGGGRKDGVVLGGSAWGAVSAARKLEATGGPGGETGWGSRMGAGQARGVGGKAAMEPGALISEVVITSLSKQPAILVR